jgi:hypothetical protein
MTADRDKVLRYRSQDSYCPDNDNKLDRTGDTIEAIQLTGTNIDAVRKWFADSFVAFINEDYVLVGGTSWTYDENDCTLIWYNSAIFSVGGYVIRNRRGDFCEADEEEFEEHFVPEV